MKDTGDVELSGIVHILRFRNPSSLFAFCASWTHAPPDMITRKTPSVRNSVLTRASQRDQVTLMLVGCLADLHMGQAIVQS